MKILRLLAEPIAIIAGIVCICCAICVMNGNRNASVVGLISLAVMVIAVCIDERRQK